MSAHGSSGASLTRESPPTEMTSCEDGPRTPDEGARSPRADRGGVASTAARETPAVASLRSGSSLERCGLLTLSVMSQNCIRIYGRTAKVLRKFIESTDINSRDEANDTFMYGRIEP